MTEETTKTTEETVKEASDIMSIENFLVELKKVNPSAGILSTVMEHNDKFVVPKSCTNDLPACLSSLHDSKYFDLNF